MFFKVNEIKIFVKRKLIIIIFFLYIFYHLTVYFRSVNKRECTTIYKVNQKEQQEINNKKNIYDQGILDEFYNIIRMKYIKSVQHCIDNNMGTNCETPNISIEDWSNIIENNNA